MEGILARLKLTPELIRRNQTTNRSRGQKINLSQKNRMAQNRFWLYGGIFLLFVFIALATMFVSLRYTKQSASYLEMIGRMQIYNQNLTNASQQALLGNEIAFVQLQDSKNYLNQFSALLKTESKYHETLPASMHVALSDELLDEYQRVWRIKENKIGLLINSRDVLINVAGIANDINIASIRLQELFYELSVQMEQLGGLSKEVMITKLIGMLARSLTKSVNTLLSGEFVISDITEQLTKEREQLLVLLKALSDGDGELGIAALKDKSVLEKLVQIQVFSKAIDDQVRVIQKQAPEVVAAKLALHDSFKINEVLLSTLDKLKNKIEEQEASAKTWQDLVFYLSIGLVLGSLIIFGRAFSDYLQRQKAIGEREVESAQKAILRLLDEMGALSEGNLTVRAAVTEDITGAIADSINYTVEELQKLVVQINQAGTNVNEVSSQAQRVSTQLLAATHNQSRQIEETTVSVLGMAESINTVASAAEEGASVAKHSLTAAEKGAIAVRDAIMGMNEIRTSIQETAKRIKRLGESSQEIGEIIALISDITEQTNVLALNAAIQAASAGEAGKGFSVIAQEVQRLAEHSAESTKQISSLVRAIQGDTKETIAAMERSTYGVVEGTKRANATGEALEEIEEIANRLAQLVAKIFDATQIQTKSVDKVTKNMENILAITRQTNDGTSQNAKLVKQISGFASELKASVAKFKV